MQTGKLAFKNMLTGSQTELTIEEIIKELK